MQLPQVVDGPPLTPPGPVVQTPGGSTTTGSTTTNVYPAPSEELMVSAEGKAAPVIIESGLRSMDKSAASSLKDLFSLTDGLDHIRNDIIFNDTVKSINTNMGKVVLLLMGVVIAAICLWGLFAQMLGSDAVEAFHALGALPFWAVLALSTMAWFRMLIDFFTALALAITQAADGSFGRVMSDGFWDNLGLGMFALFVGFFLLIALLLFTLRLFTLTAFLAFCLAFAPVFVFAKSNRFTERWGDNWFRMVPAAGMELVAMVAVLTIGGVAMQRVAHDNAGANIALLVGTLLALPLIRRLCGLEHDGHGGRVLGALFLTRWLRAARGSGATKAATTAVTKALPATQPTRAPRWGVIPNGYATTRKSYQASAATRRLIVTP